jgi:hypothetical protein
MAGVSEILTEEHYQVIKNSLDIISQTEKEITLAKMAGIDVSAQEKQMADNKAALLKIKNVYYPGR